MGIASSVTPKRSRRGKPEVLAELAPAGAVAAGADDEGGFELVDELAARREPAECEPDRLIEAEVEAVVAHAHIVASTGAAAKWPFRRPSAPALRSFDGAWHRYARLTGTVPVARR